MTVNQKIFIGIFSVFVWILALIAHHHWPDIDTTAMITLCQAVLVGLGVTHLTNSGDAPPKTIAPQYGAQPATLTQL